ncbi:Altered inheritance of mitochondria 39, mitochondrial [Gossypium arboreum]|uniref:FLZ-type domain-containing protein n=10 Tax=Gossypium TaxID=3633 RepID=A0A2P5XLI8_GOSBA|nr:FCS-Like Zinc finger 2 [Gossypium raimondii]XP_016665836.1 FCS-Like Zinc finger 2 isoform X1 [Gossypium hirsutum]XP_017625216.1 FCS-Like Zinc finger 2 [Gossypium arboreum]KAB2017962.1 hypothetical protein ES319_D08G197600v1 [Gossypium barbadense]MBA0737145.1 hypothetical protein [Gossypium gossypioides]MBA0763753.1 hypothetical protein [Gossypium trilobum]TYG58278.1 hypothetical protein ES288_D08G209800v1 [Gossypium darwinii]TYH59172.1 hypothetical protein ES332_D08G205500v1 [Gossypium to
MESSGPSRRPCFIEEDDGLASLVDMEAGYSGTHYQSCNQNGFFSRPLLCYSRRSSLRNLASSSSSSVFSPRFTRFYDARFEDHHYHQPHFLDACFLCKKPLGGNRDIFMYRGDTPFCSEECRQEQIDMDEALEKNRNLSSSMKALRKKEQRKSNSPNKAQDYPFYTGTVAAA